MIRVLKFVLAIIIFTSCQDNQIPQNAIPIKYYKHIYLKGNADGKDGNFIFDTGARNLYFDKSYYSENKFNYINTFEADLIGVGNTPSEIDVIEDSIKFNFGKHTYITKNVPILDLRAIIGDDIDGVLGMDYFENSTLEINYENKFIKKHNNNDSINFEGYSKIKLSRFEDGLTLPLEITISDSVKIFGEFQLDFGNGGSVDLTSQIAQENNLHTKIKSKVSNFNTNRGAGGESTINKFIAKELKIGNFKFNDVFMSYSLDSIGAMVTGNYFGIVGNTIYERFDVYIDFVNLNLYLKPNKYYSAPFKVSRIGFNYVNRIKSSNSWIVNGFYYPSNAKNSGLKIGDKIIEINGTSVTSITKDEEENYFDDIQKVKLKVERNDEAMEFSFNLEPVITIANNR